MASNYMYVTKLKLYIFYHFYYHERKGTAVQGFEPPTAAFLHYEPQWDPQHI